MYGTLILIRQSHSRWRLSTAWLTPWGSVPANFYTDGASVPRLLWAFARPAGRLFEAAIVHDWMLRDSRWSAMDAHNAFNQAMKHFNVPRWKRVLAYWGVRLYGKLTYGNNRRVVR